ncbi:hypothetical protein INR49_007524 [Caranx melampygus]|nr:hypothetical protein INR49_007524 [Caranx melampygus]
MSRSYDVIKAASSNGHLHELTGTHRSHRQTDPRSSTPTSRSATCSSAADRTGSIVTRIDRL